MHDLRAVALRFQVRQYNSILDSEEIRASQVEPVKPAANIVFRIKLTRRMSDTAKLSLIAGSWLFHDDDDDDANLWQLHGVVCKDMKVCFKIYQNS